MKIKFFIPQTASVIVRWFRIGRGFTDTLIPRPANNEVLRNVMLRQGVGHGEIRCVKGVLAEDLTTSINRNFGRRIFETA